MTNSSYLNYASLLSGIKGGTYHIIPKWGIVSCIGIGLPLVSIYKFISRSHLSPFLKILWMLKRICLNVMSEWVNVKERVWTQLTNNLQEESSSRSGSPNLWNLGKKDKLNLFLTLHKFWQIYSIIAFMASLPHPQFESTVCAVSYTYLYNVNFWGKGIYKLKSVTILQKWVEFYGNSFVSLVFSYYSS